MITSLHAPSSASLASTSQVSLQPGHRRSRSRSASLSLKTAFQSLVGKPRTSLDSTATRSKSFRGGKRKDKPSSHAVKLFAVRELEDDLREQRALLARLAAEFGATDDSRLEWLQTLQLEMDGVMNHIRLAATKLQAVRSFAG